MTPDDPLDSAVRSHQAAEAAKVDPTGVLAGVKRRQAADRARAAGVRRAVRWATLGTAAIAVCLLVALFLTGNTPVPTKEAAAATPAELLQEAKAVHEAAPADRCYQVTADWDLKVGMPRLPASRSARVWTRGDQFVVLSAVEDGPPWAWGQQADGRVWLAPNRMHAVVFDKDEVNDPLARFCELMSLRLVSTLGEVLERYELFRKDGGQPGEPIRIEAKLRPALFPAARFRQVELELDPDTKAVRSAVLHRSLNGQPEGKIRFTLLETATQPADFFTLEGHTADGRRVHDGKPIPPPKPSLPDPRAKLREELLKKWQNRPAGGAR
jgi:hypothetical protein